MLLLSKSFSVSIANQPPCKGDISILNTNPQFLSFQDKIKKFKELSQIKKFDLKKQDILLNLKHIIQVIYSYIMF